MSPTFISKPKTLEENKSTLDDESFQCQGETGYPTTGSIILQTNKMGTFEEFTLGKTKRASNMGSCSTNETLTVKSVEFDTSWNNTQLRCAIKKSDGTTLDLVSEEFTVMLIPGKETAVSVELRFYDSVNPFRSCQAGQFT